MAQGINFLRGFVAGGMIGAALALLFAPQSGRRTRRDIRRKSSEFYEDAQEQVSDIERQTQKAFKKGKRKAERMWQETGDKLEDARAKAQQAVEQGREAVTSLADESGKMVAGVKDQAQRAAEEGKKIISKK